MGKRQKLHVSALSSGLGTTRLGQAKVSVVTLRAISLAAQCIVIGPVCLFVLWVCYYDNWKLRASIFTKLGL